MRKDEAMSEGRYFMSKASKALRWNRTMRDIKRNEKHDEMSLSPRERNKKKQNTAISSEIKREHRPKRDP